MAADLATVAFHSLSAEARICSSVCVCVCACGCEWVSVCAQWTVCKYVHLVYMRVSPPANPLVLLSLCVVSVSLCQQLVQLLLRLATHQPSRQPVLLPRPHFTWRLRRPFRPFRPGKHPLAHIPQSLSFRFAECFCADFALILNVFYACCFLFAARSLSCFIFVYVFVLCFLLLII